jgi:adenylate cyclase
MPEEPDAHYQLGVLYQHMGDNKLSRRYFEKYYNRAEKWVKDNPTHAYSHISLALALIRLGKKEQGWSIGQKAMALDPNEHFGYARLLSVQGKIQEAIDQLERAVQAGYRDYIWVKIHPDFQPLYDEPRFKELIKKRLKR